MDIGSNNNGAAGRLSNFTPRKFVFEGVECNSMEGLLQSFKFDKGHIQREVCLLTGMAAKRRGRKRNKAWRGKQILWWKDKVYKRNSEEYQNLLNRAFQALATNDKFIKDLLSTQNATLTHSIGKHKKSDTVLTEKEFCSRLTYLREVMIKLWK